jgi:hypothetical protein
LLHVHTFQYGRWPARPPLIPHALARPRGPAGVCVLPGQNVQFYALQAYTTNIHL